MVANKKTKTKKEVLAITGIKSPDDIYQTLYRIHVEGRRDDKLAEKLICLLMKQEKWDYGYGMELYESILRQYSPPTWELEELLAVSGISDVYRNFPTAAQCRKHYLDMHPDVQLDSSGMEKHERKVLINISEIVYRDFCDKDKRLFSLYREWITEVGLDPKILEKSEPSEKRQETKPQGANMLSQASLNKGKKSKNPKREKRDSRKKKYKIVNNIIRPITVTFVRVTREKPQYGFWTLVSALPILAFLFFLSNRNLLSGTTEIKNISVIHPELSLIAGERKDPGIGVSPAEADQEKLGYTIEDPRIADMTRDWKVVGGDGWREGDDNTTTITLSGGNAENVEILITLEPGFEDKADKEIAVDNDDSGEWQ